MGNRSRRCVVIRFQICIFDILNTAPYYRGCWHGVSRCFFFGYLQYATRSALYSPTKEVYNP